MRGEQVMEYFFEMLSKALPLEALIHKMIIAMLLWIFMIVATLIDLWTGIEAAKARQENVKSGKLRRTISKVGDYWRVLAMFFIIDLIGTLFTWWTLPYASIVGTVATIAIEGKSVLENLRHKRSAAADIPGMAQKIIACKDIQEAINLVKELKSLDDKHCEK